HDETFAAEQADAELLLEGDAELDAAGAAEERVLLADQLAAKLVEMHGDDLAGIWRREGDRLAAGADGGEGRHEQRFAREHPLAGAGQLAPEALRRLRGVAEDRLHLDPL